MGNSCQPCSEGALNCNSQSVVNLEIKANIEMTESAIQMSKSCPSSVTVNNKRLESIEKEKLKSGNFITQKINSFKLTVSNQDFLINSLRRAVLFSQISAEEITVLISIMYKIECKAGQEIVNIGNPIVFFFVIKIGKFIVHDFDKEDSMILLSESIYGENSLMQVEKLNGLIKCVEDAEIYALNRKDYQNYIKKSNIDRLKEKLFLLKSCEIFSKF